jgi:phosphoribosyl 1,2-cyclic phosphodiesterase
MEALVATRVNLVVLASGSTGNAIAITGPSGWFLIDLGLQVADLRRRMAISELNPAECRGCLLTHTHGDHWRDSSLGWLASRQIPLWLHTAHLADLRRQSRAVHTIEAATAVRLFQPNTTFSPISGVEVLPAEISHDSHPTFGFRIIVRDLQDSRSNEARIGYFSDLGQWNKSHNHLLEDLHLLALEFNHHIPLLDVSPRPDFLKRRISGPKGHLSNQQAGQVVSSIKSAPKGQTLVLLHLSKECNTQEHALSEAKSASNANGKIEKIEVALQNEPLPPIPLKTDSGTAMIQTDDDFGPLFQSLRSRAL